MTYFYGYFINVQVSGSPTRDETEELTSLWQTGLWNSHIQADRFLLEDDRAIFMFKVGQVVSAVASQLRDHGFNTRQSRKKFKHNTL